MRPRTTALQVVVPPKRMTVVAIKSAVPSSVS